MDPRLRNYVSFEELINEALKLSTSQRAVLAQELLVSLDDLSPDDAEALWLEEAVRRDEALDRGEAESHPAESVFSRARSARK
jgi:hypothetical protein